MPCCTCWSSYLKPEVQVADVELCLKGRQGRQRRLVLTGVAKPDLRQPIGDDHPFRAVLRRVRQIHHVVRPPVHLEIVGLVGRTAVLCVVFYIIVDDRFSSARM